MKGSVSFVLPSYENVKYICHNQDEVFGIIDISGSMEEKGLNFADWSQNIKDLKRLFTIIANENDEIL